MISCFKELQVVWASVRQTVFINIGISGLALSGSRPVFCEEGLDDDIHPSVQAPAGLGIIGGQGGVFSIAGGSETGAGSRWSFSTR